MSETGWVRFRELEKVKDSVPRNERDRPVRVRACLHHDERERERERGSSVKRMRSIQVERFYFDSLLVCFYQFEPFQSLKICTQL